MPYYFDRVQETTTTAGNGTITLAGAVPSYQAFSAVFPSGVNRVYYTILDGTAWEVGSGTYTTAGTTLARDTVYSSSTGSKLVLSGGKSFVFLDFPAIVIQDMGGDWASWMAGVIQ